jgi:hypothetical protein
MKSLPVFAKLLSFTLTLFAFASFTFAQAPASDTLLASVTIARGDTPVYVYPFAVTVTASRLEIPLRQNAAATTVVGS